MIRNALAALVVDPNYGEPGAMSIYLAGGPKTHADGSVTWNPPARYDHAFDGKETIHRLPQAEVVKACKKLFAEAGLKIKVTPKQRGCATFKGRKGTIITIDRPFEGVTPEAVIRHERGHLNGWLQDHPD